MRNIRGFAEGLGQAFDHVLVLGIGGSALGVKALLNALREPGCNELSDEGRESIPGSPCWTTWTPRRLPQPCAGSTHDGSWSTW